MERRTARYIALVSSVIMAALLFVGNVERYAIYNGCDFVYRFIFHFFHASFLHYAMNIWCFLSISFVLKLSAMDLAIAYLCASFCPIAWNEPTIGLSGLLFVLLGRFSFESESKLKYHSYMAVFITLGLVLPNVNGIIHLYCYIAGILYGLLIHPFKWKRLSKTY